MIICLLGTQGSETLMQNLKWEIIPDLIIDQNQEISKESIIKNMKLFLNQKVYEKHKITDC